MTPEVTAFFDEATFTVSYVVRDPASTAAAIVDSVLGFDYSSGRTDTRSADMIVDYVRENGLEIDWVLETHVHADHLSAAPYLQEKLGGKIGIGAEISVVQDTFGKVFNEGTEFERDGSQFDALFSEGDTFEIGALKGRILHTPGHTPACVTFVVEDVAFVGDTLFMPDFGTARADFPGGSAEQLYRSIQKILALPDETVIFVGHDYKAPGREVYAWQTHGQGTEGPERPCGRRRHGRAISSRCGRSAMPSSAMPKLIIPSLQVNMRAGRMPPPDEAGKTYLKVPVNGI